MLGEMLVASDQHVGPIRKEDDMKSRIFITLLLFTLPALPAFAQQTNPNLSTQATSADQTTPPSQSSRQDFWDGDEPSFGALIFHPFASKAYVRRHVQPIQDRVNELDELTAAHSRLIRDVDARARQGIQQASEKDNLADEHAVEAANKAQTAHQTAAALGTRLATDETVVGNIDQYKSGPQTELHFRPGQTVLSKQSKDALDELAAQVKDQHGYIIEVQGFSSGRGQAAIANSRKMADLVQRYLVLNHEIPAYRIYVIGMGNAPGPQVTSGTRVGISLLKNDVDRIAKQQ
jgi:outer membrane protein OmpA-like peptidoglycan-associated protein